MTVVNIPAAMREVTGGARTVEVAGETVWDLIDAVDRRFPGLRDRLVEDGELRPGIAAFLDGEEPGRKLGAKVGGAREVFFLLAIGGGA